MKEPRSSFNGGRFFNDPRATSEELPKPANKTPVKPPRVTVTATVIQPEQPTAPERKISEGTPTKPPRAEKNVPPAKPPRVQNTESCRSSDNGEAKPKQSSVLISLKRPAPVPPTNDMTGKELNCSYFKLGVQLLRLKT